MKLTANFTYQATLQIKFLAENVSEMQDFLAENNLSYNDLENTELVRTLIENKTIVITPFLNDALIIYKAKNNEIICLGKTVEPKIEQTSCTVVNIL